MIHRRRIKATVQQALKFVRLESIDQRYTWNVLEEVVPLLEDVLKNEVFRSHQETYHIPDEQALVARIRAGDTTPDGAQYNLEYLQRKLKQGETRPHKLANYAFWIGVNAKHKRNELEVRWSDPGTITKAFDYITLHESKRSVLKSVFLLAWERLITQIIDKYAEFIQL